jgi:protein-tyrosine phosphatase
MGNICRSPAAEGIARKILKKKGLDKVIEIDSAGTIDYHAGEPPDPRMIVNAARRDIYLESLARQFDPEKDFEDFNYIITMDDENYQDIIALDIEKKYSNKILKIINYTTKKNVSEVPDPYHSGNKGFELVLDILEDAVNGLINEIEDEIKREYKDNN